MFTAEQARGILDHALHVKRSEQIDISSLRRDTCAGLRLLSRIILHPGARIESAVADDIRVALG